MLDDATYNNDADQGATYVDPTLAWSGALAVSQTVTITYSVTVNSPDQGNHSLVNSVVTPPDSGGGCPVGSTDPTCTVTVPVQSYTVTKTATPANPGTVNPGDTVTYTIAVKNTGEAPYTASHPATFIDNMSGVLDDARYNNDADQGATYAVPALSWSGALAVGQTITVTYSVTVTNPDAGDHKLVNAAVAPPGSGGNCPVGSSAPGCKTVTNIQSFTVTKTADPAGPVHPGDTVTYRVTLANTGLVAYSAADPASFTDDLSAV
ncbi:MAG: hypothetical protein JWO63_2445, partial [Frankiales bacterium]|nr:hypothetical protein [Frankiales bacterium]